MKKGIRGNPPESLKMVVDRFKKALGSMPKIISVRQKSERTLLDYKNKDDYFKGASVFARETRDLFSDHEVKLLIIWAIIAPSAGLAYLIWIKYPRLRVLAALLFVVSVFQFIGQWSGVLWLAQRFLGK